MRTMWHATDENGDDVVEASSNSDLVLEAAHAWCDRTGRVAMFFAVPGMGTTELRPGNPDALWSLLQTACDEQRWLDADEMCVSLDRLSDRDVHPSVNPGHALRLAHAVYETCDRPELRRSLSTWLSTIAVSAMWRTDERDLPRGGTMRIVTPSRRDGGES